jgi:2-polyprenyl-3-methyl-5-hydroxy-6-metoxy-1,4-benzoquinol methylase
MHVRVHEGSIDHQSLDEQRRFWNEWNTAYREDDFFDPVSFKRADATLTLMHSLRLRDPEILELGCSTGWLSVQLAQFGRVTAVDIADEVVARAAIRWPSIHFLAGDVMQIDLPAERFHVIVCLQTLSEIADAAGFIEKIHSWLKDGGYLILTTHNPFVLHRMDVRPKLPAQVRNWIDKKSLRNLLGRYFVLLRFTTIGPDGHRGILRFVNSYKLTALWTQFFNQSSLDRIKEKSGFGRTIVVLAQKRRSSTH